MQLDREIAEALHFRERRHSTIASESSESRPSPEDMYMIAYDALHEYERHKKLKQEESPAARKALARFDAIYGEIRQRYPGAAPPERFAKLYDKLLKEKYYVGADLRDTLIDEISALGWEGEDAARAKKVKDALQLATPHRKGYLFDVDDWEWQDFDFLKSNLDAIVEDLGHSAMSRGYGFWGTSIGRQVRALRDKL